MSRLEHVVIVNDFACINGGHSKVAIDSAVLLADAGVAVTFFAACGPVDPALQRPGIEVVCLDQKDLLADPNRWRAASRGLWNKPVATALAALRTRFDPRATVVHCHGFAKALSPAVGPVLTDGAFPTVFTMHDYFLACPNGGFYDYQEDHICTRRALGAACLSTNCDVRHASHKAWRVARQLVLKAAAGLPKRLTDVIYISRRQIAVMQPYLGRDTRAHYIPNPIAEGGDPVDAGRNDIFLFIGRLNREKGGRAFAEAAREAGAPAVFVGDGPERAEIEAANPDAVVTGWLSPAEVQDWIGRARCLVFPSLWYEGAPLVVYEALQRRVPVITGTWNAAAEAVEDGSTGLLVEEPTVASFAAAIEALMDPAHPVFAAIGKRAPPVVSQADHLRRLIELYDGLLIRL